MCLPRGICDLLNPSWKGYILYTHITSSSVRNLHVCVTSKDHTLVHIHERLTDSPRFRKLQVFYILSARSEVNLSFFAKKMSAEGVHPAIIFTYIVYKWQVKMALCCLLL